MKTMRFLVTAMSLFLAAVSCEEPKEQNPEENGPEAPVIRVSETDVNIASDGEEVRVVYKVENEVEGKSISITNEAEWLSVDAERSRVITFTAQINETGEQRHADVTVSYEGAEDVIISVTQEFFQSPLTITVSKVTATGITFSVTTSDDKLTWLPMVTYKEGFEYYETADELFQFDLEYFAYMADINDMTRTEFLEAMVAVGSMENVDFGGLQPSTDYVLYAYGITPDGRRTTDIVHAAFRTEDPYEGDITFEFTAEEEDYVLNYTITPSHTGVPYYYGINPKRTVDEWKVKHGGDLRDALQAEAIDVKVNELLDLGMIDGPEDYFTIFTESDVVDWGYFELTGATTYLLYAVKWDENCRLTGPVSTYEHTSKAVSSSDNQITLKLQNITQSSVEAVTTVTNDDPYVVMPVRKSELDGMTDDEIFVYVNEKYDYIISEYTFTGDKTKVFGRMNPEEEYMVIAFGYKAGTKTTAQMQKVSFTTLAAGDPKDCTFSFEYVPDVDNAYVEVVPSDQGQWYHWMVYPSYYTADDVKEYLKKYISGAYDDEYATFTSWELSIGTDTGTAWDLFPETEYKVGAVIMDYDKFEFLSDVHFSKPFTTPAKVYADIQFKWNYGPYYDLGELVKAGQTQFNNLLVEGNALMPLKVDLVGKYSAFYYALYANDLSDTETYPDEIFYPGLEGGEGISYKSTNLVVKYDTYMTLVAVAYDHENNPTQLYRDVLFFTKDGASPVSEFIATLPKPASRSALDFKPAEVKMPVRRFSENQKPAPDMEAKHEAAMAKVEMHRIEKAMKEVAQAKMRKSKFIAK